MMMNQPEHQMEYLTLTQIAREAGIKPSILSNALWLGEIDRAQGITAGGRTVFSREVVEAQIFPWLRRKGYRIPNQTRPAVASVE